VLELARNDDRTTDLGEDAPPPFVSNVLEKRGPGGTASRKRDILGRFEVFPVQEGAPIRDYGALMAGLGPGLMEYDRNSIKTNPPSTGARRNAAWILH